MMHPPLHETLAALGPFRLMDQDAAHADPLVRKVIATWKANVAMSYMPVHVDWQIGEDCYLLVEQTAGTLYGPGPWDDLDYSPGSRPMLEWVLTEQIRLDPAASDRDKALAIMRYARDIRGGDPDGQMFHGGAEEEIIRKRSGMCNEQTRVMIRLAQVAGLPARYVGHLSSDHGCGEIKIDGQWAYFDIRGHYYFKDDGRIASIWDLKCDPGLIERQDPEAAKDIIPGRTVAMTRTQTHPRGITAIAPYRFGDYSWIDYGWTFNTRELQAKLAEHLKPWHAVLKELHGNADFTQAG